MVGPALRPANGRRTIPHDEAANKGRTIMLRSRLFVAATAVVMAVVAHAQDSPQRKELRRVDLSGAAGWKSSVPSANSNLATSFPDISITALRRGLSLRWL